jgi:tetratricopeptide (TPR) repeat protein
LAVVGLAIALFGVGAIAVPRLVRPARPAPPAPGAASALHIRPVIASRSLGELISALQQRLRADPRDWRSQAQLGMAYVQQARISADPGHYPKAEEVLRRSLALHGKENFEALLGMASLAAARHEFASALRWAEQARAVNPHSADAHAVLGDALVELGRYDDAFATFQTMIDLRPDLSTYARASYAWELQGNHSNAVRAMELALQAAGSAVDAAWARVQLGDLEFGAGRLDRAAEHFRRAIAADESFVPAHAGLARVAAARGRIDRAIRGLEWVVERYPVPEYVIALGDLYAAGGLGELARHQYTLVEVQERLLEANGVNVDLEIALFQADHRIDLDEAVASARGEWARRRGIHVADAVAWTLFAKGRYQEAMGYANQALRLGTENALFFFHRGMIERALGRRAAARRDLARALDINPHFSILWSAEAARALESLGAGS